MFDPRSAAATAARLPHGAAPPPVGAALCDALLFPSQRRQTLLLAAAAAARSRDEELPPLWGGPSREGRLPLWYLVFANFFFFGCTATATSIIQSVLLPAQMATAAAHLHTSKNAALGVCAAIGAATQLVQPVVGAWSDGIGAWSRSPILLGGQLLMCGGCVLMLYSSSPIGGLTVSYTIFMIDGQLNRLGCLPRAVAGVHTTESARHRRWYPGGDGRVWLSLWLFDRLRDRRKLALLVLRLLVLRGREPPRRGAGVDLVGGASAAAGWN
jgi:hypothetical protein